MLTLPRDTMSFGCRVRYPVMVKVTARPVEFFLMASQVLRSGLQVRASACSGDNTGGEFVEETQRGSISSIRMASPCDSMRMPVEPLVNLTSMIHDLA